MFLGFGRERKYKNRAKAFLFIGIAIFCLLTARLYYIQFKAGPSLEVVADSQYYHEFRTNNIGFELLDCNGKNLYDYEEKYYAVINPITFYTMNEKEKFIDMKTVSYILHDYNKDYNISDLQGNMEAGNTPYEIDIDTYNKLCELPSVRGLYLYKYKQYDKNIDWNIKNILSCPVQYEDNSKLKEEGCLEREIYEYTKNNVPDVLRIEEDVSSNIIKTEEVRKSSNRRVVTTLDKRIQNLTEEKLRDEKYSDFGQIGAIVMDSSTGYILAMAQKDDNLSNVNIGVPSGNGFLLGSTFKTIVYESAIDNNIVDPSEVFEVKGIFPDSIEKRSSYTIKEAYTASSNETFAQIGWRVGLDRLYELSKKQGLFDKVLGLEQERMGVIDGYGTRDNIDIITNSSIGQTERVTPLEALSISSVVVNKGMYVKPSIIKTIDDGSGNIIKDYLVEKVPVIKESTADIIKDGMIGVVNSDLGTGSNAYISGVETGGKTGTTDYIDNKKKKSDGWFIGFFKYHEKYYSVVVFIPQTGEVEGESRTASTVFKDIVEGLINNELL